MRGIAIVRLLSVMTAMLACISMQTSAQDGFATNAAKINA